jgi:energy-converting hydrogenase Eha subunit F
LLPTFSPLFLLLSLEVTQLGIPTFLELAQLFPTAAPNSQQLDQPLSFFNLGSTAWSMWKMQ